MTSFMNVPWATAVNLQLWKNFMKTHLNPEPTIQRSVVTKIHPVPKRRLSKNENDKVVSEWCREQGATLSQMSEKTLI